MSDDVIDIDICAQRQPVYHPVECRSCQHRMHTQCVMLTDPDGRWSWCECPCGWIWPAGQPDMRWSPLTDRSAPLE